MLIFEYEMLVYTNYNYAKATHNTLIYFGLVKG